MTASEFHELLTAAELCDVDTVTEFCDVDTVIELCDSVTLTDYSGCGQPGGRHGIPSVERSDA